jgi:hypothetical protein
MAMPDPGLDATTSTSDSEAFEALNQLAGRRTLPIPAEILVGHILALPGPWDWPVRRAAFEALLRRLASARSQELAVIEGPRRGPLGRYALGSPQAAGLLSYDVRLLALDPIEARCDCTDFLRSSLGLCKHVLAVVDHLAASTPPTEEPESSLDAPANESTTSEVEQRVDSAEPPRPDTSEPIAERLLVPSLRSPTGGCQRARVSVRRHGAAALYSRIRSCKWRGGTASSDAELAVGAAE